MRAKFFTSGFRTLRDGSSNSSSHRESNRGVQPPVTLQPQYSLLSREIEWEIVPAALYNGLGLLPWSPLAGGFLAGKYERGSAPATQTRAGSKKTLYQWTSEEYADSDRNWATIDAVVRVANELGATPSQVALSWLINRMGVRPPIVGARTVAQLTDNLKAVELTLDERTTAVLEAVSAPTPGGYPYGAFGAWQRGREMRDGSIAPPAPFAGGSDHPTGSCSDLAPSAARRAGGGGGSRAFSDREP